MAKARRHDLVLWGATGFTGRLVAEYLLAHAPAELRWALGGRNEAKLDQVRGELARANPGARDLPLVVAESHDRARLDAIARDTAVVCTTVGPYARYGSDLVAACVAAGTHYCDLTGETQWIRRMIDAHHEAAERNGARIVNCCGFDSIPSDLGVLMLGDELARRGGRLARVTFYAGENRGGVSGGTVASMLQLLDEARRDRDVRRVMADPYALAPAGERQGPDGPDLRTVRFDREIGMWIGPFVMAAINTRIVRRSNALAGYPYGRDFRYAEVMSFGAGPAGLARAAGMTAGLGAVVGGVMLPVLGPVLKRRLPRPGEGPSREQRARGFFVIRLIGHGVDGSGKPVEIRGRVEGKSDPGYGETAKMLGESALCLALDGARLPKRAGVLTPATAMGAVLLERLRAAGMVFAIDGAA